MKAILLTTYTYIPWLNIVWSLAVQVKSIHGILYEEQVLVAFSVRNILDYPQNGPLGYVLGNLGHSSGKQGCILLLKSQILLRARHKHLQKS